MKAIVLTPEFIKREVIFLLLSFVVANLMNIYAIISYETSWMELISSLPILIILSFVLYVFILIPRGIIQLFRLLLKR